jgi:hypothetical protein
MCNGGIDILDMTRGSSLQSTVDPSDIFDLHLGTAQSGGWVGGGGRMGRENPALFLSLKLALHPT